MRRWFALASLSLSLALAAASTVRQARAADEAPKGDVNTLVKALKSKDAEARAKAARALGDLGAGAKPAVAALVGVLADDDAEVRGRAAYALGQIGDKRKEVVDGLARAAIDKDPAVRRAAFKAFRALKLPRDVTMPLMAKILKNAAPEDALAAIHTLASAGKEAVPFLCDCCQHEGAAYWACLALGEIGPDAADAVPDLMKLQQHEQPDVRLQAMVTLGEIGPAAKKALPGLTNALENDDFPGVRYAAAYAIGQIGESNDDAVEALKNAEKADDPFLKVVSAWALTRLVPDDAETVQMAVEQIVAGLKSEKVEVRQTAARALAETRAPAEVVGPQLLDLLGDADPAVVANAIDALASLGPKIVPRVAKALERKPLQLYAVRILARIGPDAKESIPALVAALAKAPEGDLRRELQFTLGIIGPPAKPAVDELLKSVASDDETIRNSAVFALGRIGPAAKKADPALRKLLGDEEEFARALALWALVRIEPGDAKLVAQAVPVFTKGLSGEREVARIESAATLGLLGSSAKSALPALKKALSDESPAVRQAAQKAIDEIQAGK